MNKADTPGPAVILLSGGLDSMVTAAIARERGHALHVLTNWNRPAASQPGSGGPAMWNCRSTCAGSAVRR